MTALVALVAGGYGVERVGADGKRTYIAGTPGVVLRHARWRSPPGLTEADKVVVTP